MAPPNFVVEGRVMAFHGPLLYEGKVVNYEDRSDTQDEQHWYQVHYLGWSKKWDEWVPEKFVMEYNEDTCHKQADLYKKYQDERKAEKAKRDKQAATMSQTNKVLSASKSTSKKRRSVGADVEENGDFELPLGNQMCKRLVDDWEAVTRNKQLLKLPHKVPVMTILEEFLASRNKRSGGPSTEKVWREITEGLNAYFDSALAQLLLYRFERQQYSDLMKKSPEKKPAELYGCEHLLRLFVKLPQLLVQAQMDSETVQMLQPKLMELLKFMHKNCDKYMSESNYEHASDSYLRDWKATDSI